LTSPHDVK